MLIKILRYSSRYLRLAQILTSLVILLAFALPASADDVPRFSLGFSSLRPPPSETKESSIGALTAKYGFRLLKDFTPYVGTGIAYSIPSQLVSTDPKSGIKAGMAGQAGFSLLLGGSSTLHFDYKYLSITPDAPRGEGGPPTKVIGVGIDVKF